MMRNEDDLGMLMSGDPELAKETIKVSHINVHGCHRTYASVIKRAFSRVNGARSMEELSDAIKDGIQHTSSLNVHDQIDVGLSTDENSANGIVLDLFVQEKPLKVTYALGGDVSLSGNKNVVRTLTSDEPYFFYLCTLSVSHVAYTDFLFNFVICVFSSCFSLCE